MTGPHANTTYTIVPFEDVTEDMVDSVFEMSMDTLRHSTLGEDRVVLKWIGIPPPLLVGYQQYTYSEILVEMAKPEWNDYESSSSSGA